ncbi:bifunctional diguanylate cyclase/phosphodiesterase [Persephonella sp.]
MCTRRSDTNGTGTSTNNWYTVIFAEVEGEQPVIKNLISPTEEIFGFAPEELKKGRFLDLVVEEDRERVEKQLKEIISSGKTHHHFGKLRIRSRTGEVRWVICTAVFPDKERKRLLFTVVDITEEKEEQERFHTISDVAPVGILMYCEGRPVFVNKKLAEILEYPQEELLKADINTVLHYVFPEDREIIMRYLEMRHRGIRGRGDYRVRVLTRSGKPKWVHINSETIMYRGRPAGIATIEDITKQVRLEKAYRLLSAVNREIVKSRDLKTLFKRIAEIFTTTGEFNTVWIGEIKDRNTIKPVAYEGDLKFLGKLESVLNPTRILSPENVQTDVLEQKSPALVFSVSIPVFVNNRPTYVINLFSDKPHLLSDEEANIFSEISDDISFAVTFIQKEQDLYRKEYYDSLTGLGNRKLFFSRLDEFIEQGEPFYLILIDIYNFKRINENYGEVIADQVLKEVAENLERVVSPEHLFRVGSDEFAILWKGENIYRALELIRSSFDIPISIKNHLIQPDYNVSVVRYPQDGKYRMELVLKAERTLQFAKEEGKNVIRFFNESDYINTKKFFNLEEKIEEALKNNLFYVNLQPIVSFETGDVVGAEALIRLRDLEGNYLSPADFIPVAEKTGQIVLIDNLMIKKSGKILQNWLKKGLEPVRISVNVTPSNIKMITDSFGGTGIVNFMNLGFSSKEMELLRKYITFELTEREFVEIAQRKEEMKRLREVGFHIAIDDFGTGYSSLSYLTAIDLDFIKIDIYFVKNMKRDAKIHKLVQSIINIAKIFGIKTIAEGVETQEEYDELKKLGCDMYQGYLFCPPISPEEFERFLKPLKEGDTLL